MPGGTGPLIPRRLLGAEFRRLREARGEQLQATAANLLFSPSKLSRIETGQVGPRARDIRDLVDYFDLAGTPTHDKIEAWVQEIRAPGWWQKPGFRMQGRLDRFVSYETAATSIRSHETTVISGWLQTRHYAGGILQLLARTLTQAEIAEQTELRMQRQIHLKERPNPPQMTIVLAEPALHWRVGSDEVMAEQLRHLMSFHDHPLVTLHLVPFDRGPYKAVEGGFTLFHFADSPENDVAVTESVTAIHFLTAPSDVDTHAEVFADISRIWLDRTQTREFIHRVLVERYT